MEESAKIVNWGRGIEIYAVVPPLTTDDEIPSILDSRIHDF
jgi:hypothetical protein